MAGSYQRQGYAALSCYEKKYQWQIKAVTGTEYYCSCNNSRRDRKSEGPASR